MKIMKHLQVPKNRILYNSRSTHIKLKAVICLALAVWGVIRMPNLPMNHLTTIPAKADVHIPQPTIAKVTAIFGNISTYDRAVDTHKEHSRRLGYPLIVLRQNILDGYWNKLAILLRVLLQELEKPSDKRLQWLFWFDADTVLMNPNMPLQTFLPPSNLSEIHLLLSKDWNGINNGVFFIRVHPWSIKFLSAAIAYPVTKPNVSLFWHDQSAMSKLLEENNYFTRSVVYCPPRWFNAYMRTEDAIDLNSKSPVYLQLHPGDLLVHFPGTQRKDLSERLGPYIAIANEHQEIWEPRLENTTYIKETESFWKKVQPSPPIDKELIG